MKQSDHFRENAENCAQLAERATARRSAVKGSRNCCMLLPTRTTNGCQRLPACLAALGTQLLGLKQQIMEFDRMILAWQRSNQTSKCLHCIPG